MKREYTDYIVLCASETPPEQDIGLVEMDDRDRRRGYFRCIYHFVIRRDGTIEHGHRKHTEPAMGLGLNNQACVSVCIIGGKGEPEITKAQIASTKALIAELRQEYPSAQVTDQSTVNRKASHVALAQHFAATNPEMN